MSSTKKIPEVGPGNLIPPYRNYKFFTFGEGEDSRPLKIDDARHGLGRDSAKGFSTADAWWLADAATLVYDDPRTFVPDTFRAAGLGDVKFIESAKSDTQVFVAAGGEHAVVAFRGTETGRRTGETDFKHIFIDVLTDANFKLVNFDGAAASKGRVHSGFKEAVESVWGDLSAHLASLGGGGRKFWLTGHSLGAALATVAAAKAAHLPGFDLRGLYTYGSPLVGDAAFKREFEALLKDRFGLSYYRFVHGRDIVTTVPPPLFGFTHVGTLKHIERSGRVREGVGALEGAANFLGGLLRRSYDLFGSVNSRVAAFIPEQLQDHVPTLYATHLWNAHVAEAG